MPKGGHAASGPARDPEALRRDRADDPEWTDLPDAGRDKPAPEWPLPVEPTEWERAEWERLWQRPQAVEWERGGEDVAVATYVRTAGEAAEPGAPAAVRNAFMRMRDALGLTVLGMRANRWQVVRAAPAGQALQQRERKRGRSSRHRFTVVDGDGDESA